VSKDRGDLDQAEYPYRKALERYQALEAKVEVARAYHMLGDVSLARGDRGEAEAQQRRALEILEPIGGFRWIVADVQASLATSIARAATWIRPTPCTVGPVHCSSRTDLSSWTRSAACRGCRGPATGRCPPAGVHSSRARPCALR
jgi:tetratricopeptide (TPR) repeat protein